MDSIRVRSNVTEPSLRALLAAIGSTPRLVSEVAFFTNRFHCPLPLEAIEAQAAHLATLLPIARAAGYRAGINHLTTTGHHDENLEMVADRTLARQVGLDGQVSMGALCPADARVRAFVRQTYVALASIHPDFIWVDDDVRLSGHMPTRGCCLCDPCIAAFSGEAGEAFSHASLVAAFDAPDPARRGRIRRLFLERNGRVIRDLLALVEETVHAIDPTIELGLMTADMFWEGYPFEAWAAALRGDTELPVRWRPGGGFYDDARPYELIDKAHSIGRQIAGLPSYASIRPAEIENFPYQPLRKAAQTNVLEMTAYLFAGATGSALNILGEEGNDDTETTPLLDHLKSMVPFWERLKAELAGSVPVGVWAAWDPLQIAAGRAGQVEGFFADVDRDMAGPYGLARLGIPVCYRSAEGRLAALSGRMPHALGRLRMAELLSGGVLLDAEALRSLEEMGLTHLAGATLGQGYGWDSQEIFTAHPLNRDFAGLKRDCRQSFKWWWESTAWELLPVPEAEVLARITDYQGRDRGASVTALTNELGGRVAVMSYFPWTMDMAAGKRQQMIRLCDWLSRGTMPIAIETLAAITPWVRRYPDGRMVIGLLNLGADTYDSVELTARARAGTFRLLGRDGTTAALPSERVGDAFRISIGPVGPSTFQVVLCG